MALWGDPMTPHDTSFGVVPFLEKIKFYEVVSIASGPRTIAKQYNGIITNGYRFLTRRREEFKKTQYSGVIVEVEGGNYYGKLSNIIELEYFSGYKVVLFHCDWVDIRPSRGLKKDRYGCPLVNFSRRLIHMGVRLQDDHFIISSQARQVFYIDDLKDVGWSHVIVVLARDMFNMGNKVIRDDDESYTQCMPYNLPTLYDVNEAPSWHRKDIEIEDDE
ncbi:transposon, En/Spm-like protein [Tanacetum coccineum]